MHWSAQLTKIKQDFEEREERAYHDTEKEM